MRPPRLRGFSYVGRHRYSLTLSTHNRCDYFSEIGVVHTVRGHFLQQALVFRFAIHAYCFMGDHLHLLVEGAHSRSDLRGFMNIAKQRSAFAAREWIRGRLWQPGYYDRVLRPVDELQIVARYILLNRVQAGLAKSVVDEPFVGSTTMNVNEMSRLIGDERGHTTV